MTQKTDWILKIAVAGILLAAAAGAHSDEPAIEPPTDKNGAHFRADYQQTGDTAGLYILTRRALMQRGWPRATTT